MSTTDMMVALTTVKAHLNVGGSTLDAYLTSLIKSVSLDFIAESGNAFWLAERTEYYDVVPYPHVIQLKAFPTTVLTSVIWDPDRVFTGVDAIDSSDYYLESARGLIHFDLQYPEAKGTLKIVNTGGVVANNGDACPADVEWAVLQQVLYTWESKKHLGADDVRIQDAQISVRKPPRLLDEFRRVALKYGRAA